MNDAVDKEAQNLQKEVQQLKSNVGMFSMNEVGLGLGFALFIF